MYVYIHTHMYIYIYRESPVWTIAILVEKLPCARIMIPYLEGQENLASRLLTGITVVS